MPADSTKEPMTPKRIEWKRISPGHYLSHFARIDERQRWGSRDGWNIEYLAPGVPSAENGYGGDTIVHCQARVEAIYRKWIRAQDIGSLLDDARHHFSASPASRHGNWYREKPNAVAFAALSACIESGEYSESLKVALLDWLWSMELLKAPTIADAAPVGPTDSERGEAKE